MAFIFDLLYLVFRSKDLCAFKADFSWINKSTVNACACLHILVMIVIYWHSDISRTGTFDDS